MLGVVNAPTHALLGRPLIGDGVNGAEVAPTPASKATAVSAAMAVAGQRRSCGQLRYRANAREASARPDTRALTVCRARTDSSWLAELDVQSRNLVPPGRLDVEARPQVRQVIPVRVIDVAQG
ncbi:MAG: hypothetical protein K2X97_18585, partial [Mycobacteriaceae bacterium]|nr:hypothetical protein [Mycobacteriaceae bacterium]